jgi:hypothetical protein
MAACFLAMRDDRIRALLRAQLREAGIEALGLESCDDLAEAIGGGAAPSVIVIDGAELSDAAAREALANVARRIPILVIDSPTAPAAQVPGAERIWRPVGIGDIVARVTALLAGHTA